MGVLSRTSFAHGKGRRQSHSMCLRHWMKRDTQKNVRNHVRIIHHGPQGGREGCGPLEENCRHDDGCAPHDGLHQEAACEAVWLLKERALQRACALLYRKPSFPDSYSSAETCPCPHRLAQRTAAPYVLLDELGKKLGSHPRRFTPSHPPLNHAWSSSRGFLKMACFCHPG